MTQLCGHSKVFQFVMQSWLDGYWQRKTYALKIQYCHTFSGSVCNLLVWYTSVLVFSCPIFWCFYYLYELYITVGYMVDHSSVCLVGELEGEEPKMFESGHVFSSQMHSL